MNSSQVVHQLWVFKVTAILAVVSLVMFALTQTNLVGSNALLFYSSLTLEEFLNTPWRLVSPIFLHHDIFHLLANLICWVEFARQIEKNQSGFRLFMLCLIISAISNTTEGLIVDNHFGGLSGVVLGLAGYVLGLKLLNKQSDQWYFPVVYGIALIGLFVLDAQSGSQSAVYVHISGALLGVVLAFAPTIYRKLSQKGHSHVF